MKRKKGFTLVELLAVVVILGIIMMISIPAVSRWIDRSKAETKESQKNTLVMATQSYAQGNSSVLPKVIGQTTTVSAEELRKANYLKEELKDANHNSCMKSYVKIYKYDKNAYTYTPYLYCEGDVIPTEETTILPTISISFSGNKQSDNAIHDVAISAFKVVITGGTDGSKNYPIDGYSYTIGVKYTTDINEKVVEIYNSGSLNGGGKETIVLEKSLADYTDISKVNNFVITVEAYNRVGGYFKQTANSTYRDHTPPVCGTISGQAPNENSYLTHKGDKRTISVLCTDNKDGSGCVRDKFTKTFDTEMEYGTIQISDNAGNKTDCRVRVNIDWTAPSFSATAYVHTGNINSLGAKASDAVSVSQSTLHNMITLSSYRNTVNGWLNQTNYPKGIVYVITTSDNVRLKSGQVFMNDGGIWSESNGNYETLRAGTTKNFTAQDKEYRFVFDTEGLRKAKYVVTDMAGNEITMYFVAKYDKTKPTCSTSKSHLGTTSGVNVTLKCSDSGSKCSSSNTLSYSGVKKSSTYTVQDNAGNSGNCSVSVSSSNCHCSDCYYGENTCRYGCGTCSGFTYESTCSDYGHSCSVKVTNWGTDCSCKCNCSNCYYGHNTCRYGCSTCYS